MLGGGKSNAVAKRAENINVSRWVGRKSSKRRNVSGGKSRSQIGVGVAATIVSFGFFRGVSEAMTDIVWVA